MSFAKLQDIYLLKGNMEKKVIVRKEIMYDFFIELINKNMTDAQLGKLIKKLIQTNETARQQK